MIRHLAVAAIGALVLSWVAIMFATGFGALMPTGVHFDVRSGVADRVSPGSIAAKAGIRNGDRIDFSQRDWLYHLDVDRQMLFPNGTLTIPLLRGTSRFTVTLRAPATFAPPPDAWTDFVALGVGLFYFALGITLYFLRPGAAALAFLCLALGQAMNYNNLALLQVVGPALAPFAMLVGSVVPFLLNIGWMYFGASFASSDGRRIGTPIIVVAATVPTLVYFLHFFTATILPEPIPMYQTAAVLTILVFVAAALLITVRLNHNTAAMPRLRWVAVGVWLQLIAYGAFFVDQSIASIGYGGTQIVSELAWWFAPGTLCIFYALLRTRVIDVRVIGARTLVYGSLTAIPIALFSVADWIFSRRLADARLATFVEFAVAIFFGIWLNTLHKRIDRFVERIVFASRHHAFQRLRHAIHALASVDRTNSVVTMLCDEPAAALRLASSAVFLDRGGVYERVGESGWHGCAEQLDADDPLVLFVRSQHHAVRLGEVAESQAAQPQNDGRPELAVPILQNHRAIGVSLYGRHTNGEHLDSDEEALLSELAHAAAAAFERLQSGERVRELEMALASQAHNAAAFSRASAE